MRRYVNAIDTVYNILISYSVDVTDDDATDKMVSVQVDDEESMIQFIDIPGSEVGRMLLLYNQSDHSLIANSASCNQCIDWLIDWLIK